MERLEAKEAYYTSSKEHLLQECERIELLLRIALNKKADNDDTATNSRHKFLAFHQTPKKDLRHQQLPIGEIDELENKYVALCEEIESKKILSYEKGIFLSVPTLQNILMLSRFEVDLLVLALLPEISRYYEDFFTFLHDDLTMRRPTIGLVAEMLSASSEEKALILQYFLRRNRLFEYEVIELIDYGDSSAGFSSKAFKLDERILNYLLDVSEPDSLILPFAEVKSSDFRIDDVRISPNLKLCLLKTVDDYFASDAEGKRLFINLVGPDGSGKMATAEALCAEVDIGLLVVDVEEVVNAAVSFESLLKRVFREGLLQPAGVYFKNIDTLFRDDENALSRRKTFFKMADEYSLVTFLGSETVHVINEKTLERNIFVSVEFALPDSSKRKRIWKELLVKEDTVLADNDLALLANKYRFTEGKIAGALASAKNILALHDGLTVKPYLEAVHEGCRIQSGQRLSALAEKVEVDYSWDDLALPDDRLEQLKSISNYVKYSDIVLFEWGFDKKAQMGKGLNILFTGPSGTGKTMTACIIANDLGLDIYKIDLSLIVSKYIGETEKNLSKIFKEAESSNVILFFDEADALFGKRSEIKDSHDRYANIEVNYLLQKMEEHDGVIILASNFGNNLDDAFQRRMHFSIEFPRPDESIRCKIWKNAFPNKAPLGGDIDFDELAEKFKLTGGNIRNIALHASFLAAGDSESIGMKHVAQSIKREYEKIGHILPRDFGEYITAGSGGAV